MRQLLVEIDDETFEQIERLAPARSRMRSSFIRRAILEAIVRAEEHSTAEAYRRTPDSIKDAWFDPRVWEPAPPTARRRRK